MAKLSTSARVIWSADPKDFSKEHANLIADTKVDAIRVGCRPDSENDSLKFIKQIASCYREQHEMPSIMLDITPPARGRVVGLETSITLEHGKTIKIAKEGFGGGASFLQVSTNSWDTLFEEGATIFMGYGDALLKVVKVGEEFVEAEVLNGGLVKPRTDLHVPETRKEPSFDFTDLYIDEFIDAGVNMMVIPGVATVTQIKQLREKFPKGESRSPWLVYRIDSESAHSKMRQVISSIDGIIVSRRELALSTNPALVPILTKEMVQDCHVNSKLSIVASEMLGSMQFNATPTRAEVSDIANAVFDGADAIVLSEDVPSGNYAKKAYELAQSVILDLDSSEKHHEQNWLAGECEIKDEMDAICINALKTAKRVNAKAIVCITKSGNTALRLSSLNHDIPVIAVTFDKQIKRKLNILRGVDAMTLGVDPSIDQVLPEVNNLLKKRSELQVGDRIVFVTVTLSSMSKDASNLFTIQSID